MLLSVTYTKSLKLILTAGFEPTTLQSCGKECRDIFFKGSFVSLMFLLQDRKVQQGVHGRPNPRGELSATICAETTRRASPERRKVDQRALLVPGHLQLQDSQSLNF